MPPGRAGSLESLRRLNRLRVIRALRDEGQISRADIARRTGLSRSTVSSLVADLQADGLVVERPEPGSAYGAQGGRPPILLSLRRLGRRGRRASTSATRTCASRSRTSRRRSSPSAPVRWTPITTPRRAWRWPPELVVETLADAGVARETVIGAGMGLPGPIDQGDGTVGSSAILPGWIGMAAAAELRRRLEIPVMVDNDANLGALAEAAFGAGRDAGDLIYLKISSGIGAGLILNGRLYRGSAGLAGELGHVLVEPRRHRLPLRQPRLSGDGRRHRRAGRPAAPLARRRPHGRRHARGRPRRRRRLPARDRRRGPRARPGRGHAAERAQPRDADRRRRPRGAPATSCSTACASRSPAPRCRRPRAARSSSPACSASARRCSARSRSWSPRPTGRCPPASHSPARTF